MIIIMIMELRRILPFIDDARGKIEQGLLHNVRSKCPDLLELVGMWSNKRLSVDTNGEVNNDFEKAFFKKYPEWREIHLESE